MAKTGNRSRIAQSRFGLVRADASEQIAQELRLYVDRKGLGPGDRIGTEVELAAEFGVSRATLREGLRLLAGANLIRSTQGRRGGIMVANTLNGSISQNMSEGIAAMLANKSISLPQLMETRMLLEVPLAGRAAERAAPETIADLEATVTTMEESPSDENEFADADVDFHEIIAVTAGNELMVTFTNWTLDVLVPSMIDQLRHKMDSRLIIRQHKDIQRAIARSQSTAAQRAMQRHMEYLHAMVLDLE
jgi:GntR family transcriptional regulator, transcriptional repressor for pyruvate dehydrogenase complex